MSAKNMDNHNRFRCRQVAFRLSPEEADLVDAYVNLSGLTKQDYITRRLLAQDVVVQGNPRIFKALRNQLDELLQELRRLSNGENMSPELLETIHFIAIIMNGMKEESDD